MKNHRLKNILFTVIIWLILFTIINFFAGFIVKNTYICLDSVDAKIAKESYGYFEPNQDKIILFPGLKPYHATINSLGLRSVGLEVEPSPEDIENTKDKYRILCLGDSITFGLFVNDEDTYPYQLQGILTQHNENAIVLNAGVGGGTISDYLYYLKIKGLKLRPDLVIINFCNNDLSELTRPKPLYEKMIEENTFSIFKTIKLAKLLRVFRKFEINYKYSRYLMKVKDTKVKDILTNESKDLGDILYASKYQSGNVILNPYSEDLDKNWEEYFGYLAEIIDLLKKEKIDFIYIIYSDILTVFGETSGNYQDILKEFLNEQSVDFVDLLPIFKNNKKQILKLYNNPPRDYHLSNLGNKILAEEIYKRLRE